MKKRIFSLAAATAFAIAAIAAPAAAFSPPGGSSQFSCDPNVFEGFPGAEGVSGAFFDHGQLGPWNAHINAEPIIECD